MDVIVTTRRDKGSPLTSTELDDNWDSLKAAAEQALPTTLTGSLRLPVGTTAQRDPAPAKGWTRFNDDLKQQEVFDGTVWVPVGAGASGGVGNPIMFEHDNVVTQNYTVKTGKNAGSFGPMEIASGVTVEIESGATWTIV